MRYKQQTKVTMLGLGYIGLPTAALIASNKIKVTGVDVNPQVVETIKRGKIHIVEPDLAGLVKHVTESGLLHASNDPVAADVYLIAVPTPLKGNNEPDISFVESAVKSIAKLLKEGDLVIIESTSPVGTTEKMQSIIYNLRTDLKNRLFIAYCPERVLPGRIIYELERNDRVIGGINEESTKKAVHFYRNFVKGTLHKTNARTAEMCKLVENSSRDVQIAFANELSMICDKANINVWELIELANKHPRVNILQPSTGVGGHCIAVDPWFIVKAFEGDAKLIKNAREINTYKTQWVIDKIKSTCFDFQKKFSKEPVVACMGLAFKPDIDDLRESPALNVVQNLVDSNINIRAVEPNIELHHNFNIIDANDALNESDIVVFLVNHNSFKDLQIKDKIVLDYCGFKNKRREK
jgi:UDP-N-acetyl-D-mannosaminuronic acid dehydrogenase